MVIYLQKFLLIEIEEFAALVARNGVIRSFYAAVEARKRLAYYLASLFRIHESARGLGLFGMAGEACLFKQFKHSVEFLGETAYHVGQLVEGWC